MSPKQRRRARAEIRIDLSESSGRELDLDADLSRAEVSAVLAARGADGWLPGVADVESLDVGFDREWDGDQLVLTAHATGFARQPIGTRALVAVQACSAALADSHPDIVVKRAQIVSQSGGLDGLSYDFDPPVSAGVLVVSDAVVAGDKEDRAGETVRQAVSDLQDHGVRLDYQGHIGDDADAIEGRIDAWLESGVDLLLTVGGTGLTHTDVTVEVVEPMIERPVPGLMEAIRDYGQQQTPLAFMSRGVAGLIDDTLVMTLPGSSSGAAEAVEAIFPAVLHVFKTLRKSRKQLLGDTE